MIAVTPGQQLIITIVVGIPIINIAWQLMRRACQNEKEPLAPIRNHESRIRNAEEPHR